MTEESTIKLNIAFTNPDFDDEELDEEAQNLLNQMQQLDEVENVYRTLDPNPPEGNKALGGFLVGKLTTEVNQSRIKSFLGFLSDRLTGKVVEMEVEANGKKLKIKAHSNTELLQAIEAAQKFVNE